MNKLTDEEREDWKEYRNYLQKNCGRSEAIVDAREICALIDSEKAGWEEVERLHDIAEQAQRDAEQWKTAAETQKENNLAILKEVERLKEENEALKEERQEWQVVADQGWHAAGEETKKVEKLEAKLQDALNTLNWYADQANYVKEKTLYDENEPMDFYWEPPAVINDKGERAKAAIQEGKQS